MFPTGRLLTLDAGEELYLLCPSAAAVVANAAEGLAQRPVTPRCVHLVNHLHLGLCRRTASDARRGAASTILNAVTLWFNYPDPVSRS
jgi:hypothetical protein